MEYVTKNSASGSLICNSLFGSTDIAGGIPSNYRPTPSNGPTYFQGKLILSLSFQNKSLAGKRIASAGDSAKATASATTTNAAANAVNAAVGNVGSATAIANNAASEVAADATNTGSSTIRASHTASEVATGATNTRNPIVSRMRLWDDLSDTWLPASPILERRCVANTNSNSVAHTTSSSATAIETIDTVTVNGEVVYAGTVDNTKEIALVPGWNASCAAINNSVCLRWKECPQ